MINFGENNQPEVPLDREWLHLILMAKELGLMPDEIRDFLHQSSKEIAAS